MTTYPFRRLAGHLVSRNELLAKIADLRADLITARNQAREERIAARRLLHEEQRRAQELERTVDYLADLNGDLQRDVQAEQARTADLTAALRRLDSEVRRD